MPTVATVAGYALYIYGADHAPPHFHAVRDDEEVMIAIGGTILFGTLQRAERKKILAWEESHRDQLAVQWENAQQGLPVNKIR